MAKNLVDASTSGSVIMEYTKTYDKFDAAAQLEEKNTRGKFNEAVGDYSLENGVTGNAQWDVEERKYPKSSKVKITTRHTVTVIKDSTWNLYTYLDLCEKFCIENNFDEYRITLTGMGQQSFE